MKDQRAAQALPGSTYQSSFWWSNESTDFWVYSLLLTCSVGALLALWFMWDIRHPKAEGNDRSVVSAEVAAGGD